MIQQYLIRTSLCRSIVSYLGIHSGHVRPVPVDKVSGESNRVLYVRAPVDTSLRIFSSVGVTGWPVTFIRIRYRDWIQYPRDLTDKSIRNERVSKRGQTKRSPEWEKRIPSKLGTLKVVRTSLVSFHSTTRLPDLLRKTKETRKEEVLRWSKDLTWVTILVFLV